MGERTCEKHGFRDSYGGAAPGGPLPPTPRLVFKSTLTHSGPKALSSYLCWKECHFYRVSPQPLVPTSLTCGSRSPGFSKTHTVGSNRQAGPGSRPQPPAPSSHSPASPGPWPAPVLPKAPSEAKSRDVTDPCHTSPRSPASRPASLHP